MRLDSTIDSIQKYLSEATADNSKEINDLARDLRAIKIRMDDSKKKIMKVQVSDDDLKIIREITTILKNIRKKVGLVLDVE